MKGVWGAPWGIGFRLRYLLEVYTSLIARNGQSLCYISGRESVFFDLCNHSHRCKVPQKTTYVKSEYW